LLKIANENELKSLEGERGVFPDGKQYLNHTHPYSSDLDLFGNKSLFQLLNRTNFTISNNILADWLISASSSQDILLRQEAVKELASNIDLRQKIYILGSNISNKENDICGLVDWLKSPIDKVFNRIFVIWCSVLSAITIISLILSIIGLPVYIGALLVLLNIFINNRINEKVKTAHAKVSKNAAVLLSYSSILRELENTEFSAAKLTQIKEDLKTNTVKASKSIGKLSGIVANLDGRYLGAIHFIFNTLLFWDIHNMFQLEKWRKNNSNIDKWFDRVGEFEALSSLANLQFNNPCWCRPQIFNNFHLQTKNMGHPLIPAKTMVANDFSMTGKGKIIILTGSNMSGKSTFLRTIGVNYILAMAGSCVCATEFVFSPISLLSVMRVNDSLNDNTSSFHAELKKLSSVIKAVEKKENVFLLLDEIIKGTNSIDRQIGSNAFVRQLIDNNAFGILATHDLTLTDLAAEFPEQVENYNFNINIIDDELVFDYKLNSGICKSRNASILMKKMGIKV
jgi:hypothetical protein